MCYFDHAAEDAEYEFNARYDYIREAYGPSAEGLADEQEDYEPPYLGPMGDWQFRICACAAHPAPEDEIPF